MHPMAPYRLWRLDDNGNLFLVGRFACREEAEERLRELSRSLHKQTYWVTGHDDNGGDDGKRNH